MRAFPCAERHEFPRDLGGAGHGWTPEQAAVDFASQRWSTGDAEIEPDREHMDVWVMDPETGDVFFFRITETYGSDHAAMMRSSDPDDDLTDCGRFPEAPTAPTEAEMEELRLHAEDLAEFAEPDEAVAISTALGFLPYGAPRDPTCWTDAVIDGFATAASRLGPVERMASVEALLARGLRGLRRLALEEATVSAAGDGSPLAEQTPPADQDEG